MISAGRSINYQAIITLILICLITCHVGQAQPQLIEHVSDSTVRVTAGEKYNRSRLFQLFFGKHYRKVWAAPVVVPVLKISTELKGLEATTTGGSYQTKTLRLRNAKGKEYVLRSVDKNPTQKFSNNIQNSFIGKLIRDQTSVIHPYGYYIIPTLSRSAGVYHTNPKLVYVPDEPELGEFRKDFSNMLAMLEERPTGDRSDVSSFENSQEIFSSRKAFDNIFSDPCHKVDAKAYLRARLFDVLIGDWSRREDQWRWASFPDGKGVTYRGIPRDRDHAFFKLDDGIITWIGTRFKRNLHTFHHKIKNLDGLMAGGMPMDESFFIFLTEDDFVADAEKMKAALTNSVIDEAISVWPENIQEISANEFRSKLRSRRDQLPRVAREYYRLLAREINLPASDKGDRITIERLTNGSTKVTVYSKSSDCLTDTLIGERTFYPQETRLIRVFALGGKDNIKITNSSRKGIKLEVYGGKGKDEITVFSLHSTSRRIKHLKIFDPNDGDTNKGTEKVEIVTPYKPLAEEYDANGWLLRHRLH